MYPNIDTNRRNQYFNISKFNSDLTKSVSDLAVIHININSLFPKLDHFLALIGQLTVKFDVLCFTECRLTESTKNLVKIQGYNVFHCLRENGLSGGGITVFVRCDFEINEIPQCTISNETIESLFLRVSKSTCNFTVGTMYKPPDVHKSNFIETFQQFYQSLELRDKQNLILCGDFNINLLQSASDDFKEMLQTICLIPMISQPTRIATC